MKPFHFLAPPFRDSLRPMPSTGSSTRWPGTTPLALPRSTKSAPATRGSNYGAVTPATPAAPSSLGFTGIHPQIVSGEGLPVVDVTGLFDLGFSIDGPQPRIDQTYQFTDNFTKILGAHALKFGFEMRRFEVYNPFASRNDGFFNFGGAGPFSTGDVGADFLLRHS